MERLADLRPEYESYLLRIWPGKTAQATGCRLMLQHVTTQQQYFFTDLTSLLAFIAAIIDTSDQGGDDKMTR